MVHALSNEMQLVLGRICGAVKAEGGGGGGGHATGALEAVLEAVATESGLQELMPYLAQFVAATVAGGTRDLPLLSAAVGLVASVLANRHLHAELYLHQLAPAALTCILNKRLCADPASEDHWRLRDAAAGVVATICRRFGASNDLQPRITRVSFLRPATCADTPPRPLECTSDPFRCTVIKEPVVSRHRSDFPMPFESKHPG